MHSVMCVCLRLAAHAVSVISVVEASLHAYPRIAVQASVVIRLLVRVADPLSRRRRHGSLACVFDFVGRESRYGVPGWRHPCGVVSASGVIVIKCGCLDVPCLYYFAEPFGSLGFPGFGAGVQ